MLGLTSENRGPILLKQLSAAVKFVSNPSGSNDIIRIVDIKNSKYMARYAETLEMVDLSSVFPSNFIDVMLLGWMVRRSSCFIFLISITTLATLNPPPVDPAHAPMNIRATRIVFERVGHVLKLVVEYPVEVIIDETWNADALIASPSVL